MLNHMTTPLLAHISRQINSQRPLWGLLTANEYLIAADPLYRALLAKARPHFEAQARYQTVQDAIQLIQSGHRLGELPEEMRRRVLSVKEGLPPHRVITGIRHGSHTPRSRPHGHRKPPFIRLKPPTLALAGASRAFHKRQLTQ